jgi:hypothetical protein
VLILDVKIGDVPNFAMKIAAMKIAAMKIVAAKIVSMQVGDFSLFSQTSAAHAAELLRGRVLPAACVTANQRRLNLRRQESGQAYRF